MTVKPSNDNDEVVHPAFKRVVSRVSDGLDQAAALAVLLNFNRDLFLEAAGRAYDFIKEFSGYMHEDDKQ